LIKQREPAAVDELPIFFCPQKIFHRLKIFSPLKIFHRPQIFCPQKIFRRPQIFFSAEKIFNS